MVELHPSLAEAKGVTDGDWVVIESPRGSVIMKAIITDRVPEEVVAADHGWWFPEAKEDLGWNRSNIDILTDNSYESCDPAMGATNLRTLLCNVKLADEWEMEQRLA
jgi:anaerobic selenocysteine-containing dehydrogenase